MSEKIRSGPEIVTDTLFDKNLYLFCIHFGLPGPLLDAPAASRRVQSASRAPPNSLGDASRAPILASRALRVLPNGLRNRLGSIFDQILIDFDASRAPILASRALRVLPDGLRNRLGYISDQILIDDMASEPPESTNLSRILPRSASETTNVTWIWSRSPKDNECIEYLASEQLGCWISDPRSSNPRYPPINTHPQTI